MSTFDPNQPADPNSGIFGLPFTRKESALVLVPVPWEATVSYKRGTAHGPQTILQASPQIDLFDLEMQSFYEAGIHLIPDDESILRWNAESVPFADQVIEALGEVQGKPHLEKALTRVNDLSRKVNLRVEEQVSELYREGKLVGLIGGDHSTPLGAFHAAAKHHGDFGILHFDAHFDLRKAYEGFTYSHASIMHNALEEIPQIKKLVHVGIRDFCEEEYEYSQARAPRTQVFFDAALSERKLAREPWQKTAQEIIAGLPDKVWISFDIDGLDPRFCPHTGTPVPGGLDYPEVIAILSALGKSGRKIIGFDLVEVAPGPEGDEWDGNVAMRLLYKLCGWTLVTNGKAKTR